MGMEASDEVGMFYLDQEVSRGVIMTQAEIFEAVEKVTPDDILRVARSVFQNQKLNLAVIGPQKNKNKFAKFLKI
jgi:predicted Zn-dependent peptidase